MEGRRRRRRPHLARGLCWLYDAPTALFDANYMRNEMAEQTENKPKTCIICGGPAGSREHPFPAIMGGRRMNKGIYCDTHNQGFGALVAVLGKQFEMLNAMLMVRPDRRDAPKPAPLTAEDGSGYELAGTKLSMPKPPNLSTMGLKKGDKVTVSVSDRKQFAEWQKAQKKQGWEAQFSGEGIPGRTYVLAPLNARLNFGGIEAFQAIAYLALTYFAQYFPVEARDADRQALKDRLALDLNTTTGSAAWNALPPCAWWEKDNFDDLLSANPFPFGHTIAVGVSKEDKNAYAFFSFFSTFTYGVDLGPVQSGIAGMHTVYINPLAESPPDDIKEIFTPNFSLKLKHDADTLKESLSSGRSGELANKLMRAINEKNNEMILADIETALATLSASSPNSVAESLVDKFDQGILFSLARVSSEMGAHLAETFPAKADEILRLFGSIVQGDDTQPDKLAKITSAHLALAKAAIAEAIGAELKMPITSETSGKIRLLLTEGPGMAKIGEKVLTPLLFQALGI